MRCEQDHFSKKTLAASERAARFLGRGMTRLFVGASSPNYQELDFYSGGSIRTSIESDHIVVTDGDPNVHRYALPRSWKHAAVLAVRTQAIPEYASSVRRPAFAYFTDYRRQVAPETAALSLNAHVGFDRSNNLQFGTDTDAYYHLLATRLGSGPLVAVMGSYNPRTNTFHSLPTQIFNPMTSVSELHQNFPDTPLA